MLLVLAVGPVTVCCMICYLVNECPHSCGSFGGIFGGKAAASAAPYVLLCHLTALILSNLAIPIQYILDSPFLLMILSCYCCCPIFSLFLLLLQLHINSGNSQSSPVSRYRPNKLCAALKRSRFDAIALSLFTFIPTTITMDPFSSGRNPSFPIPHWWRVVMM